MHWYIVQTKPRMELTALKNLQQQGYVCYLPLFRLQKQHEGPLSPVYEPLFPRYIFISSGQHDQADGWASVLSTAGVSKIVFVGNEPAAVTAELVAFIRGQEESLERAPIRLVTPERKAPPAFGVFPEIESAFYMPDKYSRSMMLIGLLSKQIKVSVADKNLRKVH